VKVVCPATAYDAKGLLKSAIRDNDPVMFLENTILYNDKSEVPAGEYLIPLGLADVKRAGTDLTIVATPAGHQCAQGRPTARSRTRRLGRSRRLALHPSAGRGHRPGFRSEDPPGIGGRGEQALLRSRRPTGLSDQDRAFDDLDAPVKRLTALDAPAIYSMALEKEQLPNLQRIMEAVLKML